MKPHRELDDELRALAALHALGALEGDEATAFARHLADGCAACRAEVDAMSGTAREISWAVPPATPPTDLRERLLVEARSTRPEAVGYHFADAEGGTWLPHSPGVESRVLSGAPGESSFAYLIRIAPGATVRTHAHSAVEHCMVVTGDFHVGGRILRAGDYHRADVGSEHARLFSEGGCIVLVVEAR